MNNIRNKTDYMNIFLEVKILSKNSGNCNLQVNHLDNTVFNLDVPERDLQDIKEDKALLQVKLVGTHGDYSEIQMPYPSLQHGYVVRVPNKDVVHPVRTISGKKIKKN